jgi:hypothetical protein
MLQKLQTAEAVLREERAHAESASSFSCVKKQLTSSCPGCSATCDCHFEADVGRRGFCSAVVCSVVCMTNDDSLSTHVQCQGCLLHY